MKDKCIIFVLKNNEKFLTTNIEKIILLSHEFDLYFVVRESKDRTSLILKSNGFISIDLSFDSGYFEALKAGFEFVKKLNYKTWVEFGEPDSIKIDEILRFNAINTESKMEKPILFASKIKRKSIVPFKRAKFYILLSIGKLLNDPYTKFRFYNEKAIRLIKTTFDCKIHPHDFVNLIYKVNDFIEIKVQPEKNKISKEAKKEMRISKFNNFIFSLFITPFIKRFGNIDN